MKKYIILPLVAYLIVCLVAILVPASEGYNVISWKLFVGQVYAIPVLIIAALISYFLYKRNFSNKYDIRTGVIVPLE